MLGDGDEVGANGKDPTSDGSMLREATKSTTNTLKSDQLIMLNFFNDAALQNVCDSCHVIPSHHLIHTTLDTSKILPINHQEHRKQQGQRQTNPKKSITENHNPVHAKIGQFFWEGIPPGYRGANSHSHRKKQGYDLARVLISMHAGIGENEARADDVPDQERRGRSCADSSDHAAGERQERQDQCGGGRETVEGLLDRSCACVGDRACRQDDGYCQHWGICGLLGVVSLGDLKRA